MRRGRIIAGTAVLAGALAIGGAVATNSLNDEEAIGPAQGDAEDVARGFLDAYGTFDADRAISYLTDDAITEEWGSAEEFRLEVSHRRAIGYEQRINDCEPLGGSGSGVSIRCGFDLHALRSGELGLGWYTDNDWNLTVRGDGRIVSAVSTWAFETNGFSGQMWEPFAAWVSTTYPQDAAVMYTDNARSLWRISEESNRLWEQRTREYVSAVKQDPANHVDQPDVAAYIAQVESICTAAHARLKDEPQPYEEAERRIIGETLPELRALPAPEAVRPVYQGRAFPLMEQYAEGTEAPFTPTWAFWIHQVESIPGLRECTFSGPR